MLNRMKLKLLCIFICSSHALLQPSFHRVRRSTHLRNQYGRGSNEIWPPTNEGVIRLEDSFPNGQIPENVLNLLKKPKQPPPESTWMKRTIDRILRRAAIGQEEQTRSQLDRTPFVVALSLLFFVQPMDILLVTLLSGYFCVLTQLAATTTSRGTPTLAALPPQGHVPIFVSNPLGYSITNSALYDNWLRLGVALGLMGPLAWIARHSLVARGALDASLVLLAARPLFLLCCQAVSESVSRYFPMVPLPIRILVPVAYNTVRLSYLWKWAAASRALGTTGRLLALANFGYWGLNLFAFLLPFATMKYMRAHFFSVEAEQVTTRSGLEEDLGLSSY